MNMFLYIGVGVVVVGLGVVVAHLTPQRILHAMTRNDALVESHLVTPAEVERVRSEAGRKGYPVASASSVLEGAESGSGAVGRVRVMTQNMWCHYFVKAPNKEERVSKWVQSFSDYDVVLVQEMFTVSVLGWELIGWKEFVKEEASKRGLLYHHESLPNMIFGQDSGLLILSRFPIVHASSFLFQHYSFKWEFINAKGALSAVLDVSSAFPSLPAEPVLLHVYNAHLDAKSPTALKQLLELRPFLLDSTGVVSECVEGAHARGVLHQVHGHHAGAVLGGDLNIAFNSELYEAFSKQALEPLEDAFFGLHSPTCWRNCLDYVFTYPRDIRHTASRRVLETEGDVSDHKGLAIDLHIRSLA